jgi:hypothetical protein
MMHTAHHRYMESRLTAKDNHSVTSFSNNTVLNSKQVSL